ncbi:hypothetical protein BJ742DRAFT_765446 [Cladochytrium replicatum]|nr:hypothetical protein BJ742DRAFT_765446 [Cladochytrium replicatum]
MDDDIWDDEVGDSEYDRNIAERNWKRLHDIHGVAGYKDGVTAGKESMLQQGFDEGYEVGLRAAKELGRLQGQLRLLLTMKNSESPYHAELKDVHDKLTTYSFDDVFPEIFWRMVAASTRDNASFIFGEQLDEEAMQQLNALLDLAKSLISKVKC